MDKLILTFQGLEADLHRMDLYDASVSQHGVARVLSILGHYYATGNIIHHAPKSEAGVFILGYEDGSFKQAMAIAAVSSMMAAPVGVFTARVLDQWMPSPNSEMQEVINLLQEQNRILRAQSGLTEGPTPSEERDQSEVDAFLSDREPEIAVLRSILANSFKDIFRPIGSSATSLTFSYGSEEAPITAIDADAVRRVESERIDPNQSKVIGIVTSFSRGSKSGIIFSPERERGIPFSVEIPGKINLKDEFTRSQHFGTRIEVNGQFVLWFDGSIKRFLVENVRRIED
jgi:hypothetical protein